MKQSMSVKQQRREKNTMTNTTIKEALASIQERMKKIREVEQEVKEKLVKPWQEQGFKVVQIFTSHGSSGQDEKHYLWSFEGEDFSSYVRTPNHWAIRAEEGNHAPYVTPAQLQNGEKCEFLVKYAKQSIRQIQKKNGWYEGINFDDLRFYFYDKNGFVNVSEPKVSNNA